MKTTLQIKRELRELQEEMSVQRSKAIEFASSNDAENAIKAEKEIEALERNINILQAEVTRREKAAEAPAVVRAMDPKERENEVVRSFVSMVANPMDRSMQEKYLEQRNDFYGTINDGAKVMPPRMIQNILQKARLLNPIRQIATITNIPNLIVPTWDGQKEVIGWVAEGASAVPVKSTPGQIKFVSNDFRVKSYISNSMLAGALDGVVNEIEADFAEGLAYTELHSIFGKHEGFEYMSLSEQIKAFGQTEETKEYALAEEDKGNAGKVFATMSAALYDLADMHRMNATLVMSGPTYAEYVLGMNDDGKNNIAVVESVLRSQAETFLGHRIVLCSMVPKGQIFIGDFSRLHINLHNSITMKSDQDIDKDLQLFVLSGSMDIRIKDVEAFRKIEFEKAPEPKKPDEVVEPNGKKDEETGGEQTTRKAPTKK